MQDLRNLNFIVLIMLLAAFPFDLFSKPASGNRCTISLAELKRAEDGSWAVEDFELARAWCHKKYPTRTDVPPKLNIEGDVRSGVRIKELEILQGIANETGLAIGVLGSRQQGWARWTNGSIGPWSGRSKSDLDLVALDLESFLRLREVIPDAKVKEFVDRGLQLDHSVIGINPPSQILEWDGIIIRPN